MVESYAMDKETLRQRLLEQRAALTPEQVRHTSEAVCRHLSTWSVFRRASGVLAYVAFRNEVSLQPLMDQHTDKVWALPRTLSGGRLLVCRYERGRMVVHPFGMQEPAADAPPLPLDLIDIVLVPGVGFDRFGGRIGFGGGCYDRLLPGLRAIRVGITYSLDPELVLPHDQHDCRMDWLALPEGMLRCEHP